jgi:hypothetical protein
VFQLVAQPAVFPGVELMGLQSPRGFVDTGCEMVVGGRVYLSETVAGEAAQHFGWRSPKDYAAVERKLDDALATVLTLQTELESLRTVKEALEELRGVQVTGGVLA